jgi:hypothetical protein
MSINRIEAAIGYIADALVAHRIRAALSCCSCIAKGVAGHVAGVVAAAERIGNCATLGRGSADQNYALRLSSPPEKAMRWWHARLVALEDGDRLDRRVSPPLEGACG